MSAELKSQAKNQAGDYGYAEDIKVRILDFVGVGHGGDIL